jgi:hypothetical protein
MKNMKETIVPSQVPQRASRPIGVWILTVYALLFAGIAPLLLSLFLLVSGNSTENGIRIFFSLSLSTGIVISAIGAWQGRENARKSLLVLITLNYVLIAINNYIMINSGQAPEEAQTQFWGPVLRGVLYPAIYIGYFNKDTTKEFYH